MARWPDVDAVVEHLLAGITAALGADLVGLQLTGSLSYGGFDHGSSDIDLLAVTVEHPDGAQLARLAQVHAATDPVWLRRVECGYVRRGLLVHAEPPAEPRPYLSQGAFWHPEPRYGQEWVLNGAALHEHGIALAGPPAAELFPYVSPERVRAASIAALHEEWEPLLTDDRLLDDPLQQAYVALTQCRTLHTARLGRSADKRTAATWVAESYGEPWAGRALRAAGWRHGAVLPTGKPDALALVRLALRETGAGP